MSGPFTSLGKEVLANGFHYADAADNAAAAHIAATLNGSGWNGDMTAAPWGELVLLFEPHDMGGFIFAGVRDRGADESWFNNLDLKTQNPTHWMPLPDAPTTPSTEGQGA